MPLDTVIVQHQADAPPGLLLDALTACSRRWQIVRVDLDESLPDPASVALGVSLGADASAYDASVSWLERELAWLRAMDGVGRPILGLCFGAQALAVALGGRVVASSQPERGWIELHSDEPALLASGPWQGWHRDRIEALPPGAIEIARNEKAVQGYRCGAHLALQFHPEATFEIVTEWARSDPAAPVEVFDQPDVFAQAARNAHTLFTAFLAGL